MELRCISLFDQLLFLLNSLSWTGKPESLSTIGKVSKERSSGSKIICLEFRSKSGKGAEKAICCIPKTRLRRTFFLLKLDFPIMRSDIIN